MVLPIDLNGQITQLGPGNHQHSQICAAGGQTSAQFSGGNTIRRTSAANRTGQPGHEGNAIIHPRRHQAGQNGPLPGTENGLPVHIREEISVCLQLHGQCFVILQRGVDTARKRVAGNGIGYTAGNGRLVIAAGKTGVGGDVAGQQYNVPQ